MGLPKGGIKMKKTKGGTGSGPRAGRPWHTPKGGTPGTLPRAGRPWHTPKGGTPVAPRLLRVL